MFTSQRLRLIRALIGPAAAGSTWWLFYLVGIWGAHSNSTATFLCFFFTVAGVDRMLRASLNVLARGRWRVASQHVSSNASVS